MVKVDTRIPLDEDRLSEAVAKLCRRERRFKSIVNTHGMPALRSMPQGLEGLLLTVTEQFLSLKAAAAIWTRIEKRLGPFDAQTILACPHDELMALGLSSAKARSFHGIARVVGDRTFDVAGLASLDDDAARSQLLALPGVGPWTADIYLLSALLRPDAWPWGDLALQLSAQNMFELNARPDRAVMASLGDEFRPWRAVAARLLWSHYRGLKGLQQA